MKFYALFLLLFGSLISAHAQNPGSISGKVQDQATGQPLPYVNIIVKDNGTVLTGGITDDNGDFTVKGLPLKTLSVEFQFMGYKTVAMEAALDGSNPSKNFGIQKMTEEATQLSEVEIVKETSTIEQKLDRKVITLGKDLTTAGGTASEIMNNIPSVNVDQDGNVSLRGNQNVRILVDGRPTNIDAAQLLKQIPASSIKKIELITNPSAKYNPEGMSGIINIVLHKNSNDGFNGNFNSGVNFGITPKLNSSLDMNYRKGKVNFFGNIGTNMGKQFNGGHVERFDERGSKQFIDVVNDNKGVLGKIGMDFYIDDHNTLSVYTNQNYFTGNAVIGTDIYYKPAAMQFDIFQRSYLDGDSRNNTYNLAYKHKFEKEGHTLDFETNFNDSKDTQYVNYYNTTTQPSAYNYFDDLADKRQNLTANLDYVNPLNEKSTLELGAEARIYRTDNDYLTNNPAFDAEPEQQNVNYTYDMDIYSAYGTFGQKLGKFSYQLGARFESYRVSANFNRGLQTFKDDYFQVYPSAYLTYAPTQKNMYQLSYSRRVDRPSIDQTKLVREFATPLVTSYGNPSLRPQFTNSVEANYTRMFENGSSLTGGVYYRFINDEINRVLYPNESTPNENDQIMSFGNFSHNNAYGFELSSNYKIFKWWDIQPAIDFSSIRQQGLVSELVAGTTDQYDFVTRKITANAFNARMNSNFRVNKRLSFLLFGFYRGPVNGVQNNSHEMYKIDSGARYSLLNDAMSISVRFNDMFKNMHYGFDGQYPWPQAGQFGWESRTIYVALNYRFGGGKNRAMERKQRDDNTKQGGGGMF